jgi:hypothetical protein
VLCFSRRWLAITIALVTVLVLGAIACSGSTTTTLPPTTGILVRAETLTSGRGCGRNPTQLFKYVVVVFGYQGGDPGDRGSYTFGVTSNVFDCYTDGAFIDLVPNQGNSSFRLEVYAYNEPAYAAARAAIDTFQQERGSTRTDTLRTTAPTWTTECTATQQQDVQALALCDPLSAGLSGLGGPMPAATTITVPTTSFRLSDGRLATCETAPAPDGGIVDAATDAHNADFPDAAPDAGPDAGPVADAGPPADAGAPVVFTTARIRYRLGGVAGPTTDVACPTIFSASVAAEPATYAIDVGVLDSSGNPLGQAACTVTSQTGASSTAVCPP